uniref:Uncharacterized protein n=1 Tax=Rhizophora mucronata TaxID=61149 RepID=A0A2P2PQZ5_RHIMU
MFFVHLCALNTYNSMQPTYHTSHELKRLDIGNLDHEYFLLD